MTGGTFVSKDKGMKLEDADQSVLGTCKKIEISEDDTIIIEGGGEKEDV